jgi:hypothetical protein
VIGSNQSEADTAKALNLRADLAPSLPPVAPTAGQIRRSPLGLTPDAFNPTGPGYIGTVGGAPQGVTDAAYAAMSLPEKSAAKVKSMEDATAAIRSTRNASREAEGSPPVGGWKRYLLDQQQKGQGNELNQDLMKMAYQGGINDRLDAAKETRKQTAEQDPQTIKMFSDAFEKEQLPFALDLARSFSGLKQPQQIAMAGRIMSMYPSMEALRQAAIDALGGTNKWIGKNPTEEEIANTMEILKQKAMGVAPPPPGQQQGPQPQPPPPR